MATLTWVNGIGREITDRQTATHVVVTLVSNWKLTHWRQLLTKYLQSVRKIMVNQVSPKNLYSLCCLKNYISIFICDNIEGLGCNNLLPWTKISLLFMPINNLVKIEPTLALLGWFQNLTLKLFTNVPVLRTLKHISLIFHPN